MNFKPGTGDWKQYRALPSMQEVDLHFGRREFGTDYRECMGDVGALALDALRAAQLKGTRYVMFTHGWSTSRPGATTARSVIRGLMRSPQATPFIIRAECVQHDSVFVAAIKPATGPQAS
jgi:hypothetical protein